VLPKPSWGEPFTATTLYFPDILSSSSLSTAVTSFSVFGFRFSENNLPIIDTLAVGSVALETELGVLFIV
jgi:hypothetical protein